MNSWRDSASAESQADMDNLFNEAAIFARQMFATSGEFFPYALAITQDGRTKMVAGYTGSERPPSAEVLTLLIDGLRKEAGQNRAAAIVSDVRLKAEATDAIRVELEHREGVAMTVILPYRTKGSGEDVEYGQVSALRGERHIWPGSGTSG